MRTFQVVVAALAIAAGAVAAHAANHHDSGGSSARQRKRVVRPTPKDPQAKQQSRGAFGKRKAARQATKPLKPKEVLKSWTKRLFEQYGDDLVSAFPEKLVVARGALPRGSEAARVFDALVAARGAKLVYAFRDPKSGTYAVQEKTDGESDFRLRIFDKTGKQTASASFADDGSLSYADFRDNGNGDWLPAAPPTRSDEPFRDINRQSGGNI